MLFSNFFDYILSPTFFIPFGLVALGFLPVAYSVWATWRDNTGEEEHE